MPIGANWQPCKVPEGPQAEGATAACDRMIYI
jgi:hypothetical protein